MNDFLKEIMVFNNGWIYVGFLILVSIFTTITTRFIQFRHFHNTFRAVFLVHKQDKNHKSIAPITSVFATIAGRAGTGNIIGIALAIFAAGPGVIFWLWVFAFMGMATSFCESALAQTYKVVDKNKPNIYRGGAAYYMLKGLGKNFKYFALFFAIAVFLQKGIFIVSLNINTITQVSTYTFFRGDYNNPGMRAILQWSVVAVLFVLTAIILVGGIRRIIDFSALVSPAFITVYLGLTLVIFALHVNFFPKFIGAVFANAFSPFSFFSAAGGASVGYLIRTGAQRSFFSNEAGQGTGTHAASVAKIDHPAKVGLSQSFSVFVDSMIICTLSGFVFSFALYYWAQHNPSGIGDFNQMFTSNHPVSGWNYYGDDNIAIYSVMAIINLVGLPGAYIFTVILFFFGFSSMLVGVLISEFNTIFFFQTVLKRDDLGLERKVIVGFRSFILVCVAVSPFLVSGSLFTLVDFATAINFIINGIALLCLHNIYVPIIKDFDRQYKLKNGNIKAIFEFAPTKLKIPRSVVWS